MVVEFSEPALELRIAFVIDIRRQNMLLHLTYNALIEISADRVEFLSRLFSRAEPRHLDRMATPQTLFAAYEEAPASDTMFRKNLRSIVDRLVRHHGFELANSDLLSIEYVYRAFYLAGPNLRYSFPQRFGMRFPTYTDLMLETDGGGRNHGYLASEVSFRVLRDLEKNNLLIPLVGDFGGDKTIRRVGQYVREHGAQVTAFYTSNVEQYLFQSDAWGRFLTNVSTMPINATSTLIRSYFNLCLATRQDYVRGTRSEMLLKPGCRPAGRLSGRAVAHLRRGDRAFPPSDRPMTMLGIVGRLLEGSGVTNRRRSRWRRALPGIPPPHSTSVRAPTEARAVSTTVYCEGTKVLDPRDFVFFVLSASS